MAQTKVIVRVDTANPVYFVSRDATDTRKARELP